MKHNEIVLLGAKRSVLAFNKATGERLWSARLSSSAMSDDFVSVIADETKVYAHSGGKLHCLDLFSGQMLWQDGLSGYGHGVASLAIPGMEQSGLPPIHAVKRRADAAAAASTTT